ncbi:hypothetical protein HPB47_006966 [Ixodes persulcatus]|uniref:Uncharacterized protein n=1 Tax=Ixodes persulcatus TaxID=34615 RepID=A0AC60P8Y9_IXOPE|nr:hypothetical protein HPB47_006966 [Ixodes persulcatus]
MAGTLVLQDIQNHAAARRKLDDETAEELLEKIANKDISDGDFSDDESAEADLESKRDGTELGTTEEEIKVFFGMLMLMGVLKFPRVWMNWTTSTRIPAIAKAMSAKRFFKIRAALHISDSNAPRDPNSQDKFWKVCPVIEADRQRCLLLEPFEHNSVDEQMIAFTSRVAAKQFVKGKPSPEGVKVFVRCSSDSLAHDYELY